MAISFDRDTPVLNLYAAPPKGARSQWLLWPVVAYQAIVPEPRGEGLNLFQRAVLGLAAAGVRAHSDAAERLDLPSDLAAFVAYELQARGLLDPHGDVTSHGREVLRGETASTAARESALVFVDAVGGRLWPRVLTGGAGYAPSVLTRGRARVSLGSVGRPRTVHAAVVSPTGAPVAKPSPRALLSAFQTDRIDRARHREVHAAHNERHGWTSLADAEAALSLQGTVDRVALASASPAALYVPLALFVPGDLRQGTHLRVRDPFGIGDSRELLDTLSEVRDRPDAPFALRHAVSHLQEQQGALSGEEVAQHYGAQQSAAVERVVAQVGDASGISDALWSHLVRMEEKAPEVVSGAIGAAASDRRRDVLRHAYSALERLFADVLQDLPTEGLLAALSHAPRETESVLLKLAAKVGFEIPDPATSDHQPVASLFRTTQRQCRHVVEFGGVGLPNQLAVAVLLANRYPAYPLAEVAERYPRALVTLARLRAARNAAAHGDEVETLEEDVRALVFEVTRSMLRLGPNRAGEGPSLSPGRDPSLNLDLLFLTRARHDVDATFGSAIRAYRPLRDAAVRHRADTLRAAQLLEAAPRGLDRDALTGDLAVKASAVAEKAIAAWLRTTPSPEAVGVAADSLDTLHERLDAAAHDVGALAPLDTLPDVVSRVKSRRLARALTQPTSSALSALIGAALLCAAHDPRHPAARALRAAPGALRDAIEIARLRGHGGAVPFSTPVVALLSDAPVGLIRITLQTL